MQKRTKKDFLEIITKSDGYPITWENGAEDESYIYMFFTENGIMAGGGIYGEAYMWEAKWYFSGSYLIIEGSTVLNDTNEVVYLSEDKALSLNGQLFFSEY